ncbi:MAG: EAL domain-containing protein [Devosia sp.]
MAKASFDAKSPPPAAPLQPAALAFGRRPLRSFALGIALPAFLLYVLSAALVIGAMTLMARDVDRQEDSRGISAMHSALAGFLNGLSDSVSDEGTWSEAHLNVVVKPDPAWMDNTWGTTARLGQTYDLVMVTDQDGGIIFGENNAGAIVGNVVQRFASAKAMLASLDKGIAATGDATVLTAFAADQDGPAGVAAISIHTTASAQMSVPREARRILWIERHVTPAILQEISSRYQMPLATLALDPPEDSSAISIHNITGGPVGTLSWVPDRPGEAAFNRALLPASVLLVVIGGLLVLGLGMLRRSMLKRIVRLASHESGMRGREHDNARASKLVDEASAGRPRRADTSDDDVALLLGGSAAGDFEIAYQPIFDIRAERMVGVEALLRWRRPDRSLVAQEVLSPLELSALMEKVGTLAIRRASDEVVPLLGLQLVVKVSPSQLQSDVFAEKVTATLNATGLPPHRLHLTVATDQLPSAPVLRPHLARLRGAGVQVALADFAFSPDALDYLDPGLVDGIRLGVAVTGGIGARSGARAYASTIIDAARQGGIDVTATDIDDKTAVGPLVRLGCSEFQGSVFAGPVSLATITELALAPAQERKAG